MKSEGSNSDQTKASTHPIVNVCGCGSSGSTLLAQAIDRHPLIACGDELFFFCSPMLYDQYQLVKKWRLPIRLLGLTGNPYHQGRALFRHTKAYGLSRSELWHWAADSENLNSLVYQLRDHVLQRTKKRIWAEKTPRNIRSVGKFIAAFPEARVIHIVRDPRDVIASLMGRSKHYLNGAETWTASVAAIAPYRQRKQVLELRYEDLCLDPNQVLKKVCNFLNIEYDASYFSSDAYASKQLGKSVGHNSWKVRPTEAFTTKSIGRHRDVDLDWGLISKIRLTRQYAELLGTRQWSLGELAQAYGYDVESSHSGVGITAYSLYESGWRLSAIRRGLDSLLGIPPYINIIEYPKPLQ